MINTKIKVCIGILAFVLFLVFAGMNSDINKNYEYEFDKNNDAVVGDYSSGDTSNSKTNDASYTTSGYTYTPVDYSINQVKAASVYKKMPISDIQYTLAGPSTDCYRDTDEDGNYVYTYYWYVNDTQVLYAKSDSSKVIETSYYGGNKYLTEYGDDAYYNWYFSSSDLKKYYNSHKANNTSSLSSQSSSSKSSKSDYDVEDYDDPEDFYDDHETDFEDYEEAEDYWYDYH